MNYTPGDILTIKTSNAPKGRRFTVVEAKTHRAILRGKKGAHRVLVLTGADRLGAGYYIHEDDGEKNRGRPCKVIGHEPPNVCTADDAATFVHPDWLTELMTEEPRQVAHARAMLTEWGTVSQANRDAGAEALADALVKLVAGDLTGALSAAELAAGKIRNAKVFDYVARKETKR